MSINKLTENIEKSIKLLSNISMHGKESNF